MKVEGVNPPQPGRALRIQANGSTIAVFNVEGHLFGIEARCPHAGGPLEQGRIEGGSVTCPWHGSRFNLSTGAVERGPAIKPVRAYRVRIEGNGLVVEPTSPA